FMRAYHAAHDHPKIFDDFLAHRLIKAEEYQIIEARHLEVFRRTDPDRAAACPDEASALAGWMQSGAPQPITLGRARYAEDLLEQAIRQEGVKQYVILGAGLDTFAWRRPDLLANLQVFEVDHPATQAFKRHRLQQMDGDPPDRLYFVPVDFDRENLAAALRRSAFNSQALSFFGWLGVTYYLSREAVFATLQAIAEMTPAGSGVCFDYLDTEAFVPGKVTRRVQIMMDLVQRMGEPMITGFEPSTLAADLAGLGLRLEEDLGPAEIQDRFFAGRRDGYRACEHAHFARAVVA
ncbi:MAG: class I SAM-dependent methyltransferase, partial [Deltaproteobacteria bacterium]|nr:class I SAM-dependent methyltransferase [Deltaproteobacteria bacterium]